MDEIRNPILKYLRIINRILLVLMVLIFISVFALILLTYLNLHFIYPIAYYYMGVFLVLIFVLRMFISNYCTLQRLNFNFVFKAFLFGFMLAVMYFPILQAVSNRLPSIHTYITSPDGNNKVIVFSGGQYNPYYCAYPLKHKLFYYYYSNNYLYYNTVKNPVILFDWQNNNKVILSLKFDENSKEYFLYSNESVTIGFGKEAE